VPDLIRDGENGLLIDPTSAESMRNAVSRMLSEPELAARLTAQAYREAATLYYPGVIAEKHMEVYEEVIRTKKRRKLES